MSDRTVKLDHFTAAILAEATAETEHTLSILSEKRTTAYSAAEDEVLGEAYRFIHGEVARIRTEAGRRVSRHMLDNKRALYLRREAMADEVFDAVRARLNAYTASPAYPKRMERLYTEALTRLGGASEVQIFLRPEDKALAAILEASRPGIKAAFEEGSFSLGGLIAQAPTTGKRVDATFDSVMDELSGHFAELFGLSLAVGLDEEAQT